MVTSSKPKKAPVPEPAPTITPGSDAAGQVLRRFRVVFNAVKTHFRQVEREAGVGGAQVWAMGVIKSHPGIGVNELARTMDVHQSTASNLVRALIEREMVVATRGTEDRRAVALKLLPAGARVLRKAPGPFTGVLPEALASLDEATLKRLDKDLGRLIARLEVDDRAADIPLGEL